MAKIKNPLDEYQSHSIHYVLLAARSTEAVRSFTEPASNQEMLARIDSATTLGSEIKTIDNNSAFLVIDTRRFSQFTIDNFALTTSVAGFNVPGSRSPNAVGLEMSFNVIDSVGISFANFLQYIMDQKLQVSYQGMTLLLKILFIGHKPDGSTSLIQSTSIPCIFSQIQVDLNEVRGIYECKCYPMIGVSTNSNYNFAWSSIGTASSYFTGKSANTLGAVVASFEKQLNDLSMVRYKQLNAQINPTPGATTVETTSNFGRPVQYMITIPASWENFTFAGPTTGAATEINFKTLLENEEAKRKNEATKKQAANKNSPATAKDSYVAVDPELSLTEVLDKIFEQTIEVAKLGNFSKTNKTTAVKFYKHIVSITSDDTNFTVHVDVVEFIVPNVDMATKENSSGDYPQNLFTQTTENGVVKSVPKNFVEYDYIFSGKNLDVLSLDLKIENLNIMLMQGVKLGQGELFVTADEGQNQTDGNTTSTDKRNVYGMRAKDPMLLPKRTHLERQNFSNYSAIAGDTDGETPQSVAQQYTRNISAFYNAGPITAKLELRGNPDILVGVTLPTIQQHVNSVTTGASGTSSVNTGVKSEYRAAFEKSLGITSGATNNGDGTFTLTSKAFTGPSFTTSPLFFKVNVYGPNVDFRTNEQLSGDYSAQLFYDNFYWAGTIRSLISGSKFTQEVELHSFSVFGYPGQTVQGATSSTVKDV
jgi:hypothetical protein